MFNLTNPPLRVVPPEEELWLACGRGDADAALRLLYGRGGPPDGVPPLSPSTEFPVTFTSPVGGSTTLHQSAYRGMTAVALRLIELGVEPCALDAQGKSASSVAREMGHLGLAAKLEAIGLARCGDAAETSDAVVAQRGDDDSQHTDIDAPPVLDEVATAAAVHAAALLQR